MFRFIYFHDLNSFILIRVIANLVPRLSLLPVERPWLGLVMCLPESGRLQTSDFGGGADKCEICLYKAWTSRSVETVDLTLSKPPDIMR